MHDAIRVVIVLACMGVMTAIMGVSAVLIVRYLSSLFRLMALVRTHEPALWISLSQPTFFPPLQDPRNPFVTFCVKLQFLRWFLRGGEGAQHPETKESIRETRRLFNFALLGFLVGCLCFLFAWYIAWCVLKPVHNIS
jgi:hypothetical protein